MENSLWTAVDDYAAGLLVPPDPVLDAALAASKAAGLPSINVSPSQGKMLWILAKLTGASQILEIGTLGGYSSIWLARALPANGHLTTLEADAKHADVARGNVAHAGLAQKVDVRLGDARQEIKKLVAEKRGPFDLFFIDADKRSIPHYLEWSIKLARPGSLIIVDNVVRDGALVDADSDDPNVQGVRRMHEMLAAEPRLSAARGTTGLPWRWFCREKEKRVERRQFVTTAMAMAGAALSGGEGLAQTPSGREFYQLRKYTLRTGPQLAQTQNYFEHALIPALNRLGISPVGAFKLDIGPETPTYYLLMPAGSVETLAMVNLRLADDAEFVKAAATFWNAPAAAPPFERVESSLLTAFTGWPKITAPKPGKRIFQLRTYESATEASHIRKVQMFNDAEIAIFTRTGLTPVFFADTLVGGRMPSLTYMLTFADVAELTAHWAVFVADPAWKELSTRPQNVDAEVVSNISNLYLSPLSCSQV